MSQVQVVLSREHPEAGKTLPFSVSALFISSGLISPPADIQGMWTGSPVPTGFGYAEVNRGHRMVHTTRCWIHLGLSSELLLTTHPHQASVPQL